MSERVPGTGNYEDPAADYLSAQLSAQLLRVEGGVNKELSVQKIEHVYDVRYRSTNHPEGLHAVAHKLSDALRFIWLDVNGFLDSPDFEAYLKHRNEGAL